MGRIRMEVQPFDRTLRDRAARRSGRPGDAGADPALARRVSALGPRYPGLRHLSVPPAERIARDSGMKAQAAGYSGTPLWQKLGLKAGMRLVTLDPPPDLDALLIGAPVLERTARTANFDCALAFAKTQSALAVIFTRLEAKMPDNGIVWVAWPKKSSGVATDLSEDVVRRIGLAARLVDVKVCAIDATWSGLKFVRRLRDRGG